MKLGIYLEMFDMMDNHDERKTNLNFFIFRNHFGNAVTLKSTVFQIFTKRFFHTLQR